VKEPGEAHSLAVVGRFLGLAVGLLRAGGDGLVAAQADGFDTAVDARPVNKLGLEDGWDLGSGHDILLCCAAEPKLRGRCNVYFNND
jgi:hypothetical protein